jgi:hypothetical protein
VGGWELGYVYIISLFTFEICIVLYLITLYLCVNTFFPIETTIINASKDENLTENHTTPIVLKIYTQQSVNEENSSLFMNSIL